MRNEAEPLFTPAFIALGVAELAYFTAVGVSLYSLPLFVTGPLGRSEAAAGLAFGAFAVSALLLRPYAGHLSDRLGRRPLLIGGAVLAAVGLIATAYAESLIVVVLIRLVLGVAEAAFFVAGFAALADLAPPSRMGEALSYNSLGLYLGFAFGPPLGEALHHWSGFTAAWWAAGGLALLGAVIASTLPETSSGEVEDGTPLIHRPAVPPALAFCTSMVAAAGFLAFAALHAEEIGISRPSLPLFVYGATVVVCRIAFAGVPDRLPSLPLGAAALATIAMGIGLVAVWQEPVGMFVGVVVFGIGITFSTPSFFSAIFATATPAQRGAAAGTASIFLDLGMGLGPILLGVVADSAVIPWAFGAAAVVVLLGFVGTLGLVRRAPAPA